MNSLSSSAAKAISNILKRKATPMSSDALQARLATTSKIDSSHTRFDTLPAYKQISLMQKAAKTLGIGNPFFRVHEGIGGATTVINGKEYINFSHYNYLGLNGDPRVSQEAKQAIDRYGTSASASRLVAGERPLHRQLETALAKVYDAEDCIVFVSGHATNVSAISTLFGPNDLILHDSLIHNSIIEGIRLSGATRRAFPHNDLEALDSMLATSRGQYERCLIVAEGLYSMDGDLPDLPQLIEIKKRHAAFLMLDEAHALGVLGSTGKGSAEHWAISSSEIDIWMGTLSKTLSGCGGYIAGNAALVSILRNTAPGFVYSVGMSAPLAAAAITSLEIMRSEPERVKKLRERAGLFLQLAKQAGLDSGTAEPYAVIPIIVGSSRKAVQLSNKLFERGINVQPIIHPAVEEKAARLRFFISCQHSAEQIKTTCNELAKLVKGRELADEND